MAPDSENALLHVGYQAEAVLDVRQIGNTYTEFSKASNLKRVGPRG
jgi:hypothetical protein